MSRAIFETSLFYPAHDPDLDVMDAWGQQGWRIANTVITPPENPNGVPGLLVIWEKAQ